VEGWRLHSSHHRGREGEGQRLGLIRRLRIREGDAGDVKRVRRLKRRGMKRKQGSGRRRRRRGRMRGLLRR